jgi:fibronectin type 3 domain-containing protein
MVKHLSLIISLAWFLCVPGSASSRNKSPFDISGYGLGKVTLSWSKQVRQGYNMRVWMNNNLVLGRSAFDAQQVPADYCGVGIGLEYPQGSCVEHLFGGGPWFSAIINGVRYVTEAYNGDAGDSETLPQQKDTLRNLIWHTSIYDNSYDANRIGYYKLAMNKAGYDDDGDGRMDEDPLDGIDNDGDWIRSTDDIGADGIPDSLEVGCKGVYDAVTNPDPAFDNYAPTKYDSCHPNPNGTYPRMNIIDKYTELNGLPDHGEPHVDEDVAAISPSDYYIASTDTFRTPVLQRHHKMPLKMVQKSYAWESGTAGDAIIFLDYMFVNIGKNTWQDAYVGWFADIDLGPVSVSSYYNNDYSAYDAETGTAYVDNQIDKGSTPLGLTLVGTSRPLDSLKHIFQWFDFTTRPSPGTDDSTLFSWMAGEKGFIYPDQPKDQCSDTRFFVSCGPFQVAPAETIRATFALVSGNNVAEMLDNARCARRIYEKHFFIPPVLSVEDKGTGTITVSLTPAQSPFGAIYSYILYYGTHSGKYNDSVNANDLSVTLAGLQQGRYYFAVIAVDERGNRSALSLEAMNVSSMPTGLSVENQERSIVLRWNQHLSGVVAGYNIYRHTSVDTVIRKINSALVTYQTFTDSDVWGDKTYYYSVTAVGLNGEESKSDGEEAGHLLVPTLPRIIVGRGVDFLRLAWESGGESDLRGYNVYRSYPDTLHFVKLNDTLLTQRSFLDHNIVQDTTYYYYVEAVDSTDAAGKSPNLEAVTAKMDQGILIVYIYQHDPQWTGLSDSVKAMFDGLLTGQPHKFKFVPGSSSSFTVPELTDYSMLIVFSIGTISQLSPDPFKAYLLGGGKVFFTGQPMTSWQYPSWLEFLSEEFGVKSIIQMKSIRNFNGAWGWNGFPSVNSDRVRLDSIPTGGVIDLQHHDDYSYIEQFEGIAADRILYTFKSAPYDSSAEGKTVGIRSVSNNAYYTTFPIYYLDSVGASALMNKILVNLGEKTALLSAPGSTEIPTMFRLYDAYPNPFNPRTTIRYDLPEGGNVSLVIYDVLGRIIAQLENGYVNAGSHTMTWDASQCASGVYFYRLTVNGGNQGNGCFYREIKKIMLMK